MNIASLTSSGMIRYPLEVVGESQYRDDIAELIGEYDKTDGVSESFTARLELDDNNINDPGNAVAVVIMYKTVGYLSRSDAKRYRQRLKEIGQYPSTGECRATISGGFMKRSGQDADFGIRLDLDLDTFDVKKPRVMKPQPVLQPVPTSAAAVPAETSGKKRNWVLIAVGSVLAGCTLCLCLGVILAQFNQ